MAASLNLNAGNTLAFEQFTPTDAANWSFEIDFETTDDLTESQTILGMTETSDKVTRLAIRDWNLCVLHASDWSGSFTEFKIRPSTRYKVRVVYSLDTIKIMSFGQVMAVSTGVDLSIGQNLPHIGVIGAASTTDDRWVLKNGFKLYSFDIYDDAESTILSRSFSVAASIDQAELIETESGLHAAPVNFALSSANFTEFYEWGDINLDSFGVKMDKHAYATFPKPPLGAWAFRVKVFVPDISGQIRIISSIGDLDSTRFYARMTTNGRIGFYVSSPSGSKNITTQGAMTLGENEVVFFIDFRSGGNFTIAINGVYETLMGTNANFDGIYNDLGDSFGLNSIHFSSGPSGGDNIVATYRELAIFEWDGFSESVGVCWDIFDFDQPYHSETELLSLINKQVMTFIPHNWIWTDGLIQKEGRFEGYKFGRGMMCGPNISSPMTDYEITWVGIPYYHDTTTVDEFRWQALWHKQDDGQVYLSRGVNLRFYIKSQGDWRPIVIARPPEGVRVEIKTVVTPTQSKIYYDGVEVGSTSYPTRTGTNDRLGINSRSDIDREKQNGIWVGESLTIECYNDPSLNRHYDFSMIDNGEFVDTIGGNNARIIRVDEPTGFVKNSQRETFTNLDYPTFSEFQLAQASNTNPVTYKNGKGIEGLKDFKAFIDWVNLPDDFASLVTTGQEFVIATDPLGVNRLPVDFRHYDPEQALFKAWTRMHEYGNGKIWLLYGKEGFTQPAFDEPFGELAVWDDEESVFHLSDERSNELYHYHNSAGNFKGTGYNFISSDKNIMSPVGYGTKFGNDRYHSSALSPFVDNFMFTAWVNTYNSSVDGRIMSVLDYSRRNYDGKDIALWTDKDNGQLGYAATVRFAGSDSTDLRSGEYDSNVVLDEWQHVAVHIFDGGIALWVNGVEQFRKLTARNFDFASWDVLRLAKLWDSDSNAHYPGSIATARVSKHARVESLSFEYANQSDPASFWKVGTPEDATGTDFARRVQLTGKQVTTEVANIGSQDDAFLIDNLDAQNETLNFVGEQNKIVRESKLGGVDASGSTGDVLIENSEVGDVKG